MWRQTCISENANGDRSKIGISLTLWEKMYENDCVRVYVSCLVRAPCVLGR